MDLKLFDTTNGVTEVAPNLAEVEADVQALVESAMEVMLGVRFLATEYSTGPVHGGRIDSLGLDENGAPVIVEFKRAGAVAGALSEVGAEQPVRAQRARQVLARMAEWRRRIRVPWVGCEWSDRGRLLGAAGQEYGGSRGAVPDHWSRERRPSSSVPNLPLLGPLLRLYQATSRRGSRVSWPAGQRSQIRPWVQRITQPR